MNSLEISNYKNFRHIEIDNLGNLNLIVGKNNVGKSTLLEAISIQASGGDIEWIKKLLEQRGIALNRSYDGKWDEEREIEILASLYHNHSIEGFYADPIKLSATISNDYLFDEISIKLARLREVRKTDNEGNERIIQTLVTPEQENDGLPDSAALVITNNSRRRIYPLGQLHLRTRNIKFSEAPIFQYVRTTDFTARTNAALFDKIALTPLEPILIDALHVIDPRIIAINFLKDEYSTVNNAENRVAFVALKGSNKKYRLSTMGDGINRILTIVLSLLNSSNGTLLVDEFENGLHYSVQYDIWKLIDKLAYQLNVQVFATTHSGDCINSFLKATAESNTARIIRLEERSASEIAVVYGDSDELDYIGTHDIEIR